MPNKRKGQFFLSIVAVIWGLGFVASAVSLRFFSPSQVLFFRFFGAFSFLLIVNLKRLSSITSRTILHGSVLGVILYISFLLQTIGLKYTTPSNNAFLSAINVVMVPFLAWLILRQTIAFSRVLGAMISLLGIAFISGTTSLSGLGLGDGLTLLSALFFAIHILGTDLLVGKESAWALTFIQMGSACVMSLITAIIKGEPLPVFTLVNIGPLLYLTFFSTLLGYFLQTAGQRYTNSSEASLILSTQGFFGMVGSVVLLGEKVSIRMIVGALLIFLGIALVEWRPKQRRLVSRKEYRQKRVSSKNK